MATYLDIILFRRNSYLIYSLNIAIILLGSYKISYSILSFIQRACNQCIWYSIVYFCFFLFTYIVYYLSHHDKVIVVYTAQGMLLFPLQ